MDAIRHGGSVYDVTVYLKPGFHIVVSVASVVSVVRKKFIGKIEFILSRTTSCICRFFCIFTGGFHKAVSVL